MAFGTLLISMPVAIASAVWLYLLKGWPIIEAIVAYSLMGTGSLLLVAILAMFQLAKSPKRRQAAE